MSLAGKSILAIDDTASIRMFMRVSFEDEGAIFYEAGTAHEGIALCKTLNPDIVVLDLGLPDMDGLDALSFLKKNNESIPFITVLTVRKGRDVVEEAQRKGADAYMSKPFMVGDLIELLEQKNK